MRMIGLSWTIFAAAVFSSECVWGLERVGKGLQVGRGGGGKIVEKAQSTEGSLARAIGWTCAETGVLYGGLTWAPMTDDVRLELVIFILIVFGSSAITDTLFAAASAALSAPARQVLIPKETPNQEWYNALPKPVWNPPTWMFPVAWLLVSKPTQVMALWRLRSGKLDLAARLLYALHLALGDTWNRIFFGEQKIGLGVYIIYTFVASLAASAALFARLDQTAGLLLLPTLAWVLVASALNLRIYQLVKQKSSLPSPLPRRR